MSLLAQLRRFSARSLYVTVLLVMATTLGLSFLAFQLISQRIQSIQVNPVFDQFDELQLESARVAYEH